MHNDSPFMITRGEKNAKLYRPRRVWNVSNELQMQMERVMFPEQQC